eukprot:UN19461
MVGSRSLAFNRSLTFSRTELSRICNLSSTGLVKSSFSMGFRGYFPSLSPDSYSSSIFRKFSSAVSSRFCSLIRSPFKVRIALRAPSASWNSTKPNVFFALLKLLSDPHKQTFLHKLV